MKFVGSLLAAALGATAFGASAHAAVYSLSPSVLSPDFTSTSPTVNHKNASSSTAAFTDDFTFTIATPYESLFSAAFNEAALAKVAITSADLTLFSGTPGGAATAIATTGVFDPATAATPTLTADLSTGAYFLQALVTTPAHDTASYSVIATAVSAAPEPSTWALMITGVGLAGLAVRYGRRSSTVRSLA